MLTRLERVRVDYAARAAAVGEPRIEARWEPRVVVVRSGLATARDRLRARAVVPHDELADEAAVLGREDHRAAIAVDKADADFPGTGRAGRRGRRRVRKMARHRPRATADLRERRTHDDGEAGAQHRHADSPEDARLLHESLAFFACHTPRPAPFASRAAQLSGRSSP